MPKRPAAVTQSEIERAIRAMKAEGIARVRVVLHPNRVEIAPDDRLPDPYERYADAVEDDEPVIL